IPPVSTNDVPPPPESDDEEAKNRPGISSSTLPAEGKAGSKYPPNKGADIARGCGKAWQ
ncbi:hypothetical protein OS493_038847, partial [Desmophyllum pertusum]